MKHLVIGLVIFFGACSQARLGDNPRDRKGADGQLTWRVVDQDGGQAAFLSRPGAAPDLVLWCRAKGSITLRAHIFKEPSPKPDLILITDGGTVALTNVRRQGGVRAGDRQLVEGSIVLTDAALPGILLGATNLKVTSGGVEYRASDTDSTGVLPTFTTACMSANSLPDAE